MKKMFNGVFVSLSISLLCVSYSIAEDNLEIAMATSDIDAEMNELFGVSTLDEVVTPEFEVVDLAPIATSESTIESVEEVAVREEEFSLSLTVNSIEYSLSSTISSPTIELRSIKGDVISSMDHLATDITGAFDTQELDAGYYIVRVVDNDGLSQHEAYAVAVN